MATARPRSGGPQHLDVLDVFEQAQQILAARGEDYTHRAANGSDYQLTGKMRCPKCDKAMIGTRAHGKTKVYRYYTCFSRSRYDSDKCNATRINADAIEPAVLDALSSFYSRDQARRQKTILIKINTADVPKSQLAEPHGAG